MKQKPITCLLALLLWLTSCQKEPSFELQQNTTPPPATSNSGETADGNQLTRTVFKYAADDSTYTDYFYDASGKWAGLQTTGDGAAYTDMQQIAITRGANSIITKMLLTKISETTGDEVTNEYDVEYNAATGHYTARIAVIEWEGSEAIDSTVFEYDAHERIAQTRAFIKTDPGEPFSEQARIAYVYDADGNLELFRSYVKNAQDSTKFDAVDEVRFTYDDKKNPLSLGVEALLCDQVFFVSPANVATVSYKDLANNIPEEVLLDFLYNYHVSDKPKSGKLESDEQDLAVFFRYQ